MAAIFSLLFLVAVVGFVGSLALLLAVRRRRGIAAAGCLPLVALFALLLAYLLAKFLYEELIPCVSVDRRYCDFASTQYRNLFGWEF